MQHFRPDIRKQCISGNSGTTDQDEEDEINKEYNESKNPDERAPVAVGKVIYEGGGCACPHDDCVPCRGEMSASTVNILGRV